MKLNRKILTIVLLAVLVSALIPTPAFAATITVTTDEPVYAPDDLVTINGVAEASVLVTMEVNPPPLWSLRRMPRLNLLKLHLM